MRVFYFLVVFSAFLVGEAAKIVQISDVIPIDGGGATATDDRTKELSIGHPMLQHYGHPPDGCEKDEAALQIQSKFFCTEFHRRGSRAEFVRNSEAKLIPLFAICLFLSLTDVPGIVSPLLLETENVCCTPVIHRRLLTSVRLCALTIS